MTNRFLNVSQMAIMFDLSRPTVRTRLRTANVQPVKKVKGVPVYNMAVAGPALFEKRD